MAIAILGQGVFDLEPSAATFTRSFAAPAGTDALIVAITMRGTSGTLAAAISSTTYNGVALTAGFNNYAGGQADIDSYLGYLRDPDIGAFNIVINNANTAGGVLWALALSGVRTTGSPVGVTAAQRTSSSTATSVSLGLTPSFAGSLLLAALASGNNTGTVTGFTGTGFSETVTGRYGNNSDMPYTARYRLNAAVAATTVSASFSVASPNCGGLLAEILAEASTTTDVAGSAVATLAVTGSISSGLAQAEILDASFRQLSAWTEIMSLQPDAAGVDRRIISAGVLGTPTLTLDQLAANRNYSWSFRLSDGNVRIDSAPSTQSLSPHHLALIHNGAFGQAMLLNGVLTGGIVEGAGLSGELVIATGGERIGSHGAISPGPYTGLFGRYLLYDGALTVDQVRLLALSEVDPNAVWGRGSEDDAQVSNQSLVACPLHSELDGQPSVTLAPVILDPSGGTLTITGVTQPANGILAISGLRLIYQPTRGWQGTDSASYTASDGIKSSTGRLTFRQTRPALKLTDDSITVADGGFYIFDPRTNDAGAGPLRIVAVTQGASGSVAVQPDGRVKYTHGGSGSGPSGFVSVQTPFWTTLAPANITTPSLSVNAENTYGASAGHGYDLRGKAGENHIPGMDRTTLINFRPANNSTIFGFKCTGKQAASLTWQDMKFGSDATGSIASDKSWDDKHLKIQGVASGTTTYYVECFASYGSMDAIDTGDAGQEDSTVVFQHFYARNNRDDFIQNDQLKHIIVRDFLVDGCHFFLSCRPGTPFDGFKDIEIRNGLVRMGRNPYWAGQEPGTSNPNQKSLYSGYWIDPTNRGTPEKTNMQSSGFGHNQFLKDSASRKGNLVIENTLVLLESLPLGGATPVELLPSGGSCTNVKFLYVGEMPATFAALPSGVTLETDRFVAWAEWQAARLEWLVAHGDLTGTGDDFPYLHAA